MNIVVKIGDYSSLPMTEQLFWNRVGWLQRAMLEAQDLEIRIIFFHKLQDMMKNVP